MLVILYTLQLLLPPVLLLLQLLDFRFEVSQDVLNVPVRYVVLQLALLLTLKKVKQLIYLFLLSLLSLLSCLCPGWFLLFLKIWLRPFGWRLSCFYLVSY